ncbi:type II/IV secretion system protein [Joostella atrarenae]|uniref:Type II/IV secretion system protein n=1 Tax=Joostella atrarenae TaxID=679257 RepID=A0ABS9J540_9FLAO|nr:GspE/PulE family protein [Joostella atrarenae]MCF8715537.1 type II/IV secretion system protein [Joostella atrarenae]
MIPTQEIQIEVALQQLITSDLAYGFRIIPKGVDTITCEFYIDEEHQVSGIKEELALYFGKEIVLIPLSKDIINQALFRYYRKQENKENVSNTSKNGSYEEREFLEEIIQEAKSIGSSDIHFEVFEDKARIRLRIDGLLIEKYNIPLENYLALINRIKIESNLDITEKRLPQDGRINFEDFDIRVSILPTLYGEKVVMRILGRDTSNISLDQLGMSKEEKKIYLEGVKKSNGIVLISGPTGSGKTTTLYATLKYLNDSKRNILTVEDPIEYTLQGINQVQLKEDIGLTFSAALRSFLRQDPDIIMLGEIRDAETAQMAIRASLTGHLVLSTIHTNSAMGTLTRLMDMGVPSFYISETLNISVAQRLIRLLCNSCKVKESLSEDSLPQGYTPPFILETHYKAVGCPDCYYTGYKGRTAIYEFIQVTKEVINMVTNGTTEGVSKDFHKNSLSTKAFKIFSQGNTSLEEIYSLLINK